MRHVQSSDIIAWFGLLAVLFSTTIGCTVDVPALNSGAYPCVQESDCIEGYSCVFGSEGTGSCIETSPGAPSCGVGEFLEASTNLCRLVDCGDLPAFEHGDATLDQDETTYEATASFACYVGYALEGVGSITCESTGQWSDALPVCELVDCGDPIGIVNGVVDYILAETGYQALYTCNDGYTAEGEVLHICQSNGEWLGNPVTCIPNAEPNPCSDCSEETEVDCEGVPGGNAQLDACGVCNGNSTSCYRPGDACQEGVVFGETCYPVIPSSNPRCFNSVDEINCPGIPSSSAGTCNATTYCGQEAQYPSRLTHQWLCYDESGAMLAECAGTFSPALTAFDMLTGLTWIRGVAEAELNQNDAQSYCESLEASGFGDWRLPLTRELKSLVDYSLVSPSSNRDVFNDFSADTALWSDTSEFGDDSSGYVMTFAEGQVEARPKDDAYQVLCVRGFPGDPREVLPTETIRDVLVARDASTGLMWSAEIEERDWSESLSYCEGFTRGGWSDWRLPSKSELDTIMQQGTAHRSLVPWLLEQSVWTSTTFVGDPNLAWRGNFLNASDGFAPKNLVATALCVRSELHQSADGLILEPSRNLMWTQCPLGMELNTETRECSGSPRLVPYCQENTDACNEDASRGSLTAGALFDECNSAMIAGYSDWRVPTRNELRGLVLCSNGYSTVEAGSACNAGEGDYLSPTIDSSFFRGFPATSIATATSYSTSTASYYVDFSGGETDTGPKTAERAVLCVREGL